MKCNCKDDCDRCNEMNEIIKDLENQLHDDEIIIQFLVNLIMGRL